MAVIDLYKPMPAMDLSKLEEQVMSQNSKPCMTMSVADRTTIKPLGGPASMSAAFLSGRRTGKSYTAALMMRNEWSMLYYYGDCKKTPELHYIATNPAFGNRKNKFPRGVLRKLNALTAGKNSKSILQLADRKELFMLQQPSCPICESKQMELVSVGQYGNWRCRSCHETMMTTESGRTTKPAKHFHVRKPSDFPDEVNHYA